MRSLIVVTMVVAGLITIDVLTHGSIRTTTRAFSVPVVQSLTGAVGSLSFNSFISFNSAEETARLKARVQELESLATSYEALSLTHTRLMQEAGVVAPKRITNARVITTPSASPYGTFLIDGGTARGVVRGALVTSQGIALGTVVDVSSNHAQVLTFFAPDATLGASVNDISVVLHGYGGANAHADAPRGAAIAEGAIVYAPSLGWRPIGVVSTTAHDASQSSTRLIVRPALNLDTLEYVTVESL